MHLLMPKQNLHTTFLTFLHFQHVFQCLCNLQFLVVYTSLVPDYGMAVLLKWDHLPIVYATELSHNPQKWINMWTTSYLKFNYYHTILGSTQWSILNHLFLKKLERSCYNDSIHFKKSASLYASLSLLSDY